MNTARLESRQEYVLYEEYVFFPFIEFIGGRGLGVRLGVRLRLRLGLMLWLRLGM